MHSAPCLRFRDVTSPWFLLSGLHSTIINSNPLKLYTQLRLFSFYKLP